MILAIYNLGTALFTRLVNFFGIWIFFLCSLRISILQPNFELLFSHKWEKFHNLAVNVEVNSFME